MSKTTNLENINQQVEDERNKRLALFPALSSQEIERRRNINLTWPDVVNMFKEGLQAGRVIFDFSYYKSVNLGNTIISAIPDKYLKMALKHSKYEQKLFALFNIGDRALSLNIGDYQRQNLPNIEPFNQNPNPVPINSEIIINCSNVGSINGNVKFSPKSMSVSYMFDGIESLDLDTREMAGWGQIAEYMFATRGDNSLSGTWNMEMFSMQQARIASDIDRAPKMTTGSIAKVYNNNVTQIKFFDYSAMKGDPLYYDTNGKRLIPTQETFALAQADYDKITEVLNCLKTEKLSEEESAAINSGLKDLLDDCGYYKQTR